MSYKIPTDVFYKLTDEHVEYFIRVANELHKAAFDMYDKYKECEHEECRNTFLVDFMMIFQERLKLRREVEERSN